MKPRELLRAGDGAPLRSVSELHETAWAAEREACDMQFTHEVFLKLVADIVAAIPAAQAA